MNLIVYFTGEDLRWSFVRSFRDTNSLHLLSLTCCTSRLGCRLVHILDLLKSFLWWSVVMTWWLYIEGHFSVLFVCLFLDCNMWCCWSLFISRWHFLVLSSLCLFHVLSIHLIYKDWCSPAFWLWSIFHLSSTFNGLAQGHYYLSVSKPKYLTLNLFLLTR